MESGVIGSLRVGLEAKVNFASAFHEVSVAVRRGGAGGEEGEKTARPVGGMEIDAIGLRRLDPGGAGPGARLGGARRAAPAKGGPVFFEELEGGLFEPAVQREPGAPPFHRHF